MAKYGKRAQSTVASAMHRRKHGTLRSSSGQKVTSREQAIAIGLNEAREKGQKVPDDPNSPRRSAKRGAKRSVKRAATGSAKSTATRSSAKRTSTRAGSSSSRSRTRKSGAR
jgi:hypothetical protein